LLFSEHNIPTNNARPIKGSKDVGFCLVDQKKQNEYNFRIFFSEPNDVIRISRDPAHSFYPNIFPQNSDDSLWLEFFVSWSIQTQNKPKKQF